MDVQNRTQRDAEELRHGIFALPSVFFFFFYLGPNPFPSLPTKVPILLLRLIIPNPLNPSSFTTPSHQSSTYQASHSAGQCHVNAKLVRKLASELRMKKLPENKIY